MEAEMNRTKFQNQRPALARHHASFVSWVACLTLFSFAVMAGAAPTVEQWGVYEVSLNGPTNGNPFTDVQFSARFYQGAASMEANGFYDGDGVYRVRFMPEATGE